MSWNATSRWNAYVHRWYDDMDLLMDIDFMTVVTIYDQVNPSPSSNFLPSFMSILEQGHCNHRSSYHQRQRTVLAAGAFMLLHLSTP